MSKYTVECPICLDEGCKEWYALEECGHTFCRTCLDRHLQSERRSASEPRCPCCRAQLLTGDSWRAREVGVRVYLPVKKAEDDCAPQESKKASPTACSIDEVEDGDEVAVVEEGGESTAATALVESRDTGRRKTCGELRIELRQRDAQIEALERSLSSQKQKLSSAKVRAAKEKSLRKEDEARHKQKLERKAKEVEKLRKLACENKERLQEEHIRYTTLQLKFEKQGFFSDTNLDRESIQRGLRGEDLTSQNALLTSSLAYRNQEYNKLQYKYNELKKHEGPTEGTAEALALDNKKLRDKLRRNEEELRGLRERRSKARETMAATASAGAGRGKLGGAYKRGEGLGDSRRAVGDVPSFIDPARKRAAAPGSETGSSLIFVGHDGVGGKRKFPSSWTNENRPPSIARTEHRLPPRTVLLGSQGSSVASASAGSGAGIKLSKKRNEIITDPRRHSNLVLEHFFDRDS